MNKAAFMWSSIGVFTSRELDTFSKYYSYINENNSYSFHLLILNERLSNVHCITFYFP